MRMGKFLVFLFFFTSVCLIYIHQKTQIVADEYMQKKLLDERTSLYGEKRRLLYEREKLHSPQVLSAVLRQDNRRLVLSNSENTVYVAVRPEQRRVEKSIFDRAVAVIMPPAQARE
jgi:hypothetical protein